MQDKVRGVCDDCRKVYRVPSASRTYTCKACGGTVRAQAGRVEVEGARAERGTGGEPRPQRERYRPRQSSAARSPWLWLAAAGLLAVGGAGWYMVGGGAGTTSAAETEGDLESVVARFVDDWKRAELDAMAGRHHPDGRRDFRARLGHIVDRRQWQSGFADVLGAATASDPSDQELAALLGSRTEEQDDAADPKTATTELDLGEHGYARIRWQYEPNRSRWYIYDFKVAPPALAPRVEAFRSAWIRSDLSALEPFFRPESFDEMKALVLRELRERGWEGNHPALGDAVTTGEENARTPRGRWFRKEKVESTFGTDRGEVLIRWVYRDSTDQWYVGAFRLP